MKQGRNSIGSLVIELKKIDLVKSYNLISLDGWIDFFPYRLTKYVCIRFKHIKFFYHMTIKVVNMSSKQKGFLKVDVGIGSSY